MDRPAFRRFHRPTPPVAEKVEDAASVALPTGTSPRPCRRIRLRINPSVLLGEHPRPEVLLHFLSAEADSFACWIFTAL